MSAGVSGAAAALLVGVAVLVWPRASRTPLDSVVWPATGRESGASTERAAFGESGPTPSLWQQDPVDLYRRWRLRRRPGDLLDDVLDLLRGIGPGLEAGLTPSRAIDLAATSTLGAERVALARLAAGTRRLRAPGKRWVSGTRQAPSTRLASASSVHDIDVLVGRLLIATEQAQPVSPVWAEWAQRSASAELALVAAAWRLSETTGAPLASAVDRAVRSLLDARARRGKVAIAVAGPRATVTVLTVLPLTGPLFGMACGIDPTALYLGSPIATVSACTGVALVWGGRAWCRRMIRTAVRA